MRLLGSIIISLLCLFHIFPSSIYGVPLSGAIILDRNGNFSTQYSSGRVLMYGIGPFNTSSLFWGNICRYRSFGQAEADVICHQLTYTGASSWSYAGIDTFGTDSRPTLLDDVNCVSSDFIMLFQCYVSTAIDSQCRNDANDVSVTCYTSRLWDNPFNGQVRLSGGSYVNEGLLEVYCHGRWGTVCDNTFGSPDATAVCRQLGYSQYYRINTLPIVGNTPQPIWLNELSCSHGDRCIADCQRCPGDPTSRCIHLEDVTIICYSSTASGSSNPSYSVCKYNNNAVILGATFGTLGGVIIIIIIIVLILRDKQKKGEIHIKNPFANWRAWKARLVQTCCSCSSYTCVCPCQKRTDVPEVIPTPARTQPAQPPPPSTSTPPTANSTTPANATPPTATSTNYPPPTHPSQPVAPPSYNAHQSPLHDLAYPGGPFPSVYPPPNTSEGGFRKEEPPEYDPTWAAYPPPPPPS